MLWAVVPGAARGEWYNPAWSYRRAIEVRWDAKTADPKDALALASFSTAGHAAADGGDLLVATDDGKPVPFRVLPTGDDGRLAVLFSPQKLKTNYYVYFGNAAKERPRRLDPPLITRGMLFETAAIDGGRNNTTERLAGQFDKGRPIGAAMVDRPFVGWNPVADRGNTISRVTGRFDAPAEGEYQFALSADDRGGLLIDDKPVLYAGGFPDDIRFNTTLKLTAGAHKMTVYLADDGGDLRLSVGWKPPGAKRVEPMPASAFGTPLPSTVGRLEKLRSDWVADMQFESVGECFINNNTSYRLKLFAVVPESKAQAKVTWDYGDGQVGVGKECEHVFLTGGVYAVKVTIELGKQTDTQAFNLRAERDPQRMVNPPIDEPPAQARVISSYDFGHLPAQQNVAACSILAATRQIDPLLLSVAELCAQTEQPRQQEAIDALAAAIDTVCDHPDKIAPLVRALSRLTPESNLQPKAADLQAKVLLWRAADFKRAAETLGPYAEKKSENLKRLALDAMLLSGDVTGAKQLAATLRPDVPEIRQAALSGALARSVEFFVDQGDLDAAEERWDDWQRQFPANIFEGYSVWLKVRMLSKPFPAAAADVAEAFAKAVGDSPYAPQLLDRAAELLAKTDPTRAAALRKLLKDKYPEDPLSQK